MSNLRTIVVGDVHGCLEELDELLAVVEYVRGKDRLIFVGDLVDRGPDSVGCVRRARELGAEVVLGNHEEKHLRWRRWERKVASGEADKNPMAAFDEEKLAIQAGLSEDDWEWMETWPLFLRFSPLSREHPPEWAVVHGGCLPNVPLEKQGKNLVRIRYVDLDTKRFKPSQPGVQPENTRYWSELWKGPESLLYGHAVHSLSTHREDLNGVGCYGLDTGCVFGGILTAAVFKRLIAKDGSGVPAPTGAALHIVRVPAKRKYSDSPCDYDD